MTLNNSAKDEHVAEYKRLLRRFLNLRPSGTRQKLAQAFGTHKSFISQITNPNYRVPLPEQHIQALIRVCHLSLDEQREFLVLYRRAHPSRSLRLVEKSEDEAESLIVPIPAGMDADRRREAEQLILDVADGIFAIASNRKPSP